MERIANWFKRRSGKVKNTNVMSRVWDRPEEDTPLRSFPLEKGDKAEPPVFIIVASWIYRQFQMQRVRQQ